MLAAVAEGAHLNAPRPIEIRTLFTPDDLPLQYLPAESDRTVGIRLTVRPDGHVQGCDAEYTSGIDGLDVYTCKLAKRRARYAPALAGSGTPSYAVYRTSVRWIVTDFGRPGPPPNVADLTLTVNQLPAGMKGPDYISVVFEIDEQGHASSCSLPIGKANSVDPELSRIACDQILKSYKPTAARDQAGTPVPSVQDAVVAFSVR